MSFAQATGTSSDRPVPGGTDRTDHRLELLHDAPEAKQVGRQPARFRPCSTFVS